MSYQLSPDGRWAWDGVSWRPVSPDGRLYWTGLHWLPLPESSPQAVLPEGVLQELHALADETLGNRAKKVHDALNAAERSPDGLRAAIAELPTIPVLFVDPLRLQALAERMRELVDRRLRT